MDSVNPESPPPVTTPTSGRTSGSRVSSARRRAGTVLAVVVLAVLGLTLWQTWDYWRPEGDDDATPFRGARGGAPGFGAMPPGGFAAGQAGGGPDSQAPRRQLHERIRAALAADDEEWAKIEPKLERVTSIQDRLRPPAGGLTPPPFGGPAFPVGGPRPADPVAAPGGAGGRDSGDVAETTAMLRAAVEDEHTSPEALAANLAAARAARAKLMAELKTAQVALRQQVTPRQEAVLVTFGVLE